MLLDTVNLERWAVSLFALAVMWWSFRGVRELAQGKFWPPSFYLASVFWFGFGALSFELAHVAQVFRAEQAAIGWWRIVNFTAILIGLLCAEIGHRRGDALKARQFYRLYDHLGEALAIVELATIDPEAGRRIAEECRQMTVKAMLADG